DRLVIRHDATPAFEISNNQLLLESGQRSPRVDWQQRASDAARFVRNEEVGGGSHVVWCGIVPQQPASLGDTGRRFADRGRRALGGTQQERIYSNPVLAMVLGHGSGEGCQRGLARRAKRSTLQPGCRDRGDVEYGA